MNKKISEDLLQAYGEMVPEEMLERIEKNILPVERTVMMKKKMNLNALRRYIAGAAAALILIAGGILGGIYYANHMAVDSLVDIDVNPGIELSVNKKEQVLKAEAINEDAIAILDGMKLKNTDLKVAVNAIIGSMVQKGHLESGSMSGILISVQNDDPARAKALRKEVNDQVHSSLRLYETEASVIDQTIEPKNDASAFAAAHKISLGKATFVLNLARKDASLKAEELAAMSLKEIAALVKERKLDISDIVDYDADDSVWENIADEIEDTNEDQQESQVQKPAESKPAETKPAYIGIEKAKTIALEHAGIKAANARFEKAEMENDDGVASYELEFRSGNIEYEYDIHAESGKILSAKTDREDEQRPAATPNPTTSYIGVEKAKSIALNHAGIKGADARFEKAELDKDDGAAQYEIEFKVNQTEYSYDIRATDGKILDFEKDLDD